MTRTVTLVLVDPTGRPLGALPSYQVESPWWQEAEPVVRGAPVDVVVLRLLTGESDRPGAGGQVTYLAEVAGPPAVALRPVPVDLTGHPLRAPYAEPGGPAASVGWARSVLERLGRPATEVTQRRTWNLSAIWRLDGPHGPAWLKQVPGFFRHEAAVLRHLNLLAEGRVPVLLAADDSTGRMLLDHVPGEDRYGADTTERVAIAADQHDLQVRTLPAVDDLVADGVPDLRGPALDRWIRALIPADAPLDGLAERLAEVARCGLPDTLVHGDLHPGNVRGDGHRRVIIDWGDAFVGHPAFDILRLTEGLAPDTADPLVAAWCARWRASVPGCDPQRAVELLRPVASLRMAAVYAMFLANIEPSERPYHADDVPRYLAQWRGRDR
ncbi:aminoglycoside phosphotransferase family protein [Micromonospora sp. KC213]|uniref:phosphotransferase family protein n=1 Tax=Micromonospora sp. KC213 TaxID=2530378 RepID=UPI00104D7C63|nr:aminoglycoside phosphotransferase family protein [Micromonospora sp. KC213]TDC43099.1 aminoglycoside phosphotransferase family protein [Micromonospora sp. KC213]